MVSHEMNVIDRPETPRADSLAVIEEMLRVTRRTKLLGGGLIAAMGVPLLLLPLAIDQPEAPFIAGLGALAVGLGGFFLAQAARLRNPREAPLYRTLNESPERVVWFYEDITRVNGVDNYSVVLWCADGTKLELNLKRTDPNRLLATLSEMLPHAVFGFTPERMRLFRRAPAQFAETVRVDAAPA